MELLYHGRHFYQIQLLIEQQSQYDNTDAHHEHDRMIDHTKQDERTLLLFLRPCSVKSSVLLIRFLTLLKSSISSLLLTLYALCWK